jgi:hypothetical protein
LGLVLLQQIRPITAARQDQLLASNGYARKSSYLNLAKYLR